MKTRVMILAVLVGLLMFGIWTPFATWGQSTGGNLRRLSADFQNFDLTETSTIVGVGGFSDGAAPGDNGTLVYQKTVFTPASENVLYVTISAVADTHGGSALWLNCQVDAVDCNPGTGGAAGTPPGYVALNKLPVPTGGSDNCNDGGGGAGDCHDNAIYYTWCTPIGGRAGAHTVQIRLASSISGATVFFETAHFYIDSNKISGNACTPAEPVS